MGFSLLKIPPHRREPGLFADNGKFACVFSGAPGVDEYPVMRKAKDIPGFFGSFPGGEDPADFEFPLWYDEG
jgi:hypothetical protein